MTCQSVLHPGRVRWVVEIRSNDLRSGMISSCWIRFAQVLLEETPDNPFIHFQTHHGSRNLAHSAANEVHLFSKAP